MNPTTQPTIGQYRVGIDFNPGGLEIVNEIKAKAAELIDLCEKIKNAPDSFGERARLASLAQTHFEDGAMWAVKMATKKQLPIPAENTRNVPMGQIQA